MEKTEDIIINIKKILSFCRAETHNILDDPIIKQWDKINLEEHTTFLADLGITYNELHGATDGYKKTAQSSLQRVANFENELSNLEADLRFNSLSAVKSCHNAQLLLREVKELHEPLSRIQQYRKIVTCAAQDIKEQVSLKNLIQLSRADLARFDGDSDAFENGYSFFTLVTNDSALRDSSANIHDLADKTEKLEIKYHKLELSEIPKLPLFVLTSQLETCFNALKDIHQFLGYINRMNQIEISQIDSINQEIRDLKKQQFSVILVSLAKEKKKLIKTIQEFRYKTKFIKEIKKINILLESLNIFYNSLRYSYLPHLISITKDSNSPLNPLIFSATKAADFFRGFKGFIHRIKSYFFASITAVPLNKETLTQKIFVALSSCPYYYCTGKTEENVKLPDFVDSLINQYRKPYPYDDLHKLIMKTITDYGSLIEKDFDQFKTEETAGGENKDEAEPTSQPLELMLGRLQGRIELGVSHIKSLQKFS